MSDVDLPLPLRPPLPPPPPPLLAPSAPTPIFGRSPTLAELLPPIQPEPPFWKRHRRGLMVVVGVVVVFALAFVVQNARHKGSVSEAKVGDCLTGDVDSNSTFRSGKIVACTEPHTRQVYAVGSTDKSISLLDAPVDPELVRICQTEVDPKIVEALVGSEDLSFGYIVSTNRTGRIVCVVVGPERTSSLIDVVGG